jgi:hypothetical protein
MEIMVRDMTRAKLMQICVVAVVLVAVASVVLGARVTVATAAALLAVCLVPPAILLVLWPGAEPPTIAEVLHDGDRRP